MYLPQFHQVKENDEWWGEGFTEWTAVKGASSLYKGHNQPRVPWNKNYYDLLEYDTLLWQSELMKTYQIDGMCMYHYWFENGKRILEKPAENLLKWTDISMPFCFCWANETWSRTWKKLLDSNSWSDIYEQKNRNNESGILLKQSYGREKDWQDHFEYLLPFFMDKRYIKVNGMPVFVILKPSKIFSLYNMMDYFNQLAMKHGLPGIFVIGMEKNGLPGLDAACIKQPGYAMEEYNKQKSVLKQPINTYPYDKIWENILKQKVSNEKVYLCAFVDFDNTPRMGKNGHIMEGVSSSDFYKNFKELYLKNLLFNNEFLFINAWNEWGEGMYLEPDEKNGYEYLEVISKVKRECTKEEAFEKYELSELQETEADRQERLKNKDFQVIQRYNLLLNDWMCLKELHIDFSDYFKKYNYKKIAIYGMGKLGKHLLYELKKGETEVLFGIDRNHPFNMDDLNIYLPEMEMPKVDAVVITIMDQYASISKMLRKNMACSMIPLEEIILELMPA